MDKKTALYRAEFIEDNLGHHNAIIKTLAAELRKSDDLLSAEKTRALNYLNEGQQQFHRAEAAEDVEAKLVLAEDKCAELEAANKRMADRAAVNCADLADLRAKCAAMEKVIRQLEMADDDELPWSVCAAYREYREKG
jgi:hypothetical protein